MVSSDLNITFAQTSQHIVVNTIEVRYFAKLIRNETTENRFEELALMMRETLICWLVINNVCGLLASQSAKVDKSAGC